MVRKHTTCNFKCSKIRFDECPLSTCILRSLKFVIHILYVKFVNNAVLYLSDFLSARASSTEKWIFKIINNTFFFLLPTVLHFLNEFLCSAKDANTLRIVTSSWSVDRFIMRSLLDLL